MRTALASLALLAALATAAPAAAELRVTQVFGTQGSAPGQLNQTEDVTTDSAGDVYVASTANARVDKFGPDGVYLQSFGSRGSAAGQLGLPIGVAVGTAGDVWVSDNDGSRGRITVYNADGSLLRTFGSVGTGDGQFRSPGPVALDAAGNAYIVDTSNQRVQKFSPAGAFITKWGSQGSGDGQFNNPRGITVDPTSGNVLVADRDNRRIQRFSPDGTFLGKFGTPAAKTGSFSSVYDVTAAANGDLFTADNNLFDIEGFTNAGAFLFQANPANTFNGTAAQALRPVSVAVAPSGAVYAVGTQGPAFVAKLEQVAPQPVIGKTAAAQLVKGTVLVRAPGATVATPLTKNSSSIPIGSAVDARHGTVSIGTALGKGTKTQTGQFSGGQFGLRQATSAKQGLTDIVMQGVNLKKVCSAKRAGAAAVRERHLFSNVHGHFRTRGRYSTATVRGTKWLTKDTCKGTLTKVSRGSVTVRDLVKHRNVIVKAGHSYTAGPKKSLGR